MITIKELTQQEYNICIKEPNAYIAFYSFELCICNIVNSYLAETIEEHIELLKAIIPYKKSEFFQILYKDKNICVMYVEMIE